MAAGQTAAAIAHRNHLFRLYQQNKSSESKVKFKKASNHDKKLLEAAKLAYADKIKELPQTMEINEAWRDTYDEGYIHQFQPESLCKTH